MTLFYSFVQLLFTAVGNKRNAGDFSYNTLVYCTILQSHNRMHSPLCYNTITISNFHSDRLHLAINAKTTVPGSNKHAKQR